MQTPQSTGTSDSEPTRLAAASGAISEAALRNSAVAHLGLLETEAAAANGTRRAQRHVRAIGASCIWPRGLRDRYGVSAPTLWRWERAGKLPKRDVFVGGRPVGWRPETIERAERGD